MKATWVAIGVIVAALGGFFIFVQQAKTRVAKSTQALQEGFSEINRPLQDENHRLDLQVIGTETDIVRTQYGDATARLYEKCRLDPPKVAVNQAKCQKLIDKVNQRWAKEKAAEEAAQKKW